jgi:hypothetical protein
VALDQSFAGRTYPPTAPYYVSREKIREFAEAIGAPDAAYRDLAAAQALGHPDVIAPPTFPVVVTSAAGQMIIDDPRSAWTTHVWSTVTSGSATPGPFTPGMSSAASVRSRRSCREVATTS